MMGWLTTVPNSTCILPSVPRALETHLPHPSTQSQACSRTYEMALRWAEKELEILSSFVPRGLSPSQYAYLICNLSLPSLSRTRV